MEDEYQILHLLVGDNDKGAVREELPAQKLSNGKFLLLASPGLALGIAKDDIISIDAAGRYQLSEHGGNFCIQMYIEKPKPSTIEEINRILKSISGSLDGSGGGVLAFSIPCSAGFDFTNEVLEKIKLLTGAEYYYSNIYQHPNSVDNEELTDWAKKMLRE